MSWLAVLSPGVWIHEGAHALACAVGGVKVHRVVVKSHSGMVVHDHSNVRNSILIGFAPLLLGGLLSWFLFAEAKHVWPTDALLSFFLGWLAFAIGFHALPSHQDLANIPTAIQRRFAELWSGPHNVFMKAGKSVAYTLLWVAGAVLVLVGWLVNQSILFRAALGVGLFWVA